MNGRSAGRDTVTTPGATLAITIPDPHLWTPDDPYLYDLQLTLIDRNGQKVFAALGPHFEFRQDDLPFCKTVYGDSEILADFRLIYLPDGFALSVLEPDARNGLPELGGKYALTKTAVPGRFDWVAAFDRSPMWRRIAASEDLTLFRSTVK